MLVELMSIELAKEERHRLLWLDKIFAREGSTSIYSHDDRNGARHVFYRTHRGKEKPFLSQRDDHPDEVEVVHAVREVIRNHNVRRIDIKFLQGGEQGVRYHALIVYREAVDITLPENVNHESLVDLLWAVVKVAAPGGL